MAEIVHASPLPGRAKTPCCGKTIAELGMQAALTCDLATVTCGVIEYATGRRDFTFCLHGGGDDLEWQLNAAFKRDGFQVREETMNKIMAGSNPFYEVGLRCWLNVETGRIGIEKVLP